MSWISKMTSYLYPKVTLRARDDKTVVDIAYQLAELGEMKSKVKWYLRKNLRTEVTSYKFGLRRNMTLREQLVDDQNSKLLSTKLACAIEVMLR